MMTAPRATAARISTLGGLRAVDPLDRRPLHPGVLFRRGDRRAGGRAIEHVPRGDVCIRGAREPRRRTRCGSNDYADRVARSPRWSRGGLGRCRRGGGGGRGGGAGGAGTGGTDEWIQIGLIAFPNGTTRIYDEVTRPGKQPVQTTVRKAIVTGERHRFAVVEIGGRPNWWRVWLDGRPVGEPVFLPRSH